MTWCSSPTTAWGGQNDLPHLIDQLHRTLINAHAWTFRVIRLRIQVQPILHVVDKLGTHRGNHPFLDLPELEDVFFRVRRTVSDVAQREGNA